MKALILVLVLAASCKAEAVYDITYLGGQGRGFTATYALADPPNLTTYDGSFGGFNRVLAGDGNPAYFGTEADVTLDGPYFYYADAGISLGASQTFILLFFGDKDGQIVMDASTFIFPLASISEGVTETFSGVQASVFGQGGPITLTISNVAPEPGGLALLALGLVGLLAWRRDARSKCKAKET